MCLFKIGLDLSIRSTGITISQGNSCKFFIVTDKISKKLDNNISEYINIIKWRREDKCEDKLLNENVKSRNIFSIFNKITEVIELFSIIDKIESINIEGISYGSSNTSSIIELAGLNYLIRVWCIQHNINFKIIPPTSLKKFATGNGSAVKELMVESFCRLFPMMRDEIKKGYKIDDIADSYFLSQFI